MGDMLVAYEDDVPKDRGLKVSGHCALDSGLGCANTFAPYCIYTPPAKVTGTLSYPSFSGNSQRMCVLGRSNHVCLSQIATRYANLAAGILI